MINIVMIVGNLGRDPEVRATPAGGSVANFTVATNRVSNGERQTDWHRVVCFGKTAETVGTYLHKGSKVAIVGSVRYRKYTDKTGQERLSTEIIADQVKFLDPKPSEERTGASMVVDTQAEEDDLPY